ncbi:MULTISPECIES: hypothetical protein [Bradyrhizobium]|nr:hypothetical protein [Bradyrhizobium elkanii]MCP1733386.1 hypothetical protein [Bradyrhizobium elkanii]MCP1750993.1 hypothetical protein [Bradyrhizobium elkanii]MCP1976765.1 hypothetical protein [Bradyrhizobium elkanii]MCS3523838.1 hypothetical protein [Bradyrhizobium elkanii]MCS3568724.1 hypothetical protein [Bradyrhizobium elkanii]
MQIDMFRRALGQRFDPLTTDRLKVGLAEIEAKKAALHPETTGVDWENHRAP